MFSRAHSYDLKDIACHDVMEETVDFHLKWFPDQAGAGRCFDKHGESVRYSFYPFYISTVRHGIPGARHC